MQSNYNLVVMYECELWTIKKTEHQEIINIFELRCPERIWQFPWFVRKSAVDVEIGLNILWKDWCCWNHAVPDARATIGEKTWCWENWRRRRDGGGWMVRWHHWSVGAKFRQAQELVIDWRSCTCVDHRGLEIRPHWATGLKMPKKMYIVEIYVA